MSIIGNKSGFTLIEAMLTVVVLAVGLIGILRAYQTSLSALGAGQENIAAFCLLGEKMSEVEQQAKEEKGLSAGTSRGEFKDTFENYEWEMEIKSGPIADLNEAVLTVYYKDHPRRYSLATYVDAKK